MHFFEISFSYNLNIKVNIIDAIIKPNSFVNDLQLIIFLDTDALMQFLRPECFWYGSYFLHE